MMQRCKYARRARHILAEGRRRQEKQQGCRPACSRRNTNNAVSLLTFALFKKQRNIKDSTLAHCVASTRSAHRSSSGRRTYASAPMNRNFTMLRGSSSRTIPRPRVTNVLHSRNETRRYVLYVYNLHNSSSTLGCSSSPLGALVGHVGRATASTAWPTLPPSVG
jgi:hypothetical protein